jgi:hypothetical protein
MNKFPNLSDNLTSKIKVENKQLLDEKTEEDVNNKLEVGRRVKNKKNEEKLTEYVAILLSKTEKEKLDKIALKEERSLSYIIRKTLRDMYKI